MILLAAYSKDGDVSIEAIMNAQRLTFDHIYGMLEHLEELGYVEIIRGK